MFGSSTQSSTAPSFGGFGSNATSGSAFGSKPAGTTTGGGLFGSAPTATTQPSTTGGGLFGAKPAGTTGGLFGSSQPQQQQQQQGGGLFGALNTTAQQPSGGLFGGQQQQQQPQQQQGGLFGSNNQTQQSGGLFGAKPATTTGGGLFGNQANTSTTGTTGGLFGAKPATTGGGLFGGQQQSTSTGGGLFGGQQASTTGGGLFGNRPATTSGGLFGGQTQQQIPQQQQQQQQPQLTAMTRVGDLPANIKNELEQFDKYINTQHLIATTLNADMTKHDDLINTIPKDINYLQNKVLSTKQALKFDFNQLLNLKNLNNEVTEDINKIMHLILQLSTPGTKLSSSFQLNEFFIKKIKKYYELLNYYEGVIKEIEGILTGLEKSCTEGFGNLFSIVGVIKSQYKLFMELCETMAQLHNEINRLTK
ncbi:Nucleoporin NUP49/NSP49 [Candida viswanathii]|uniref:Nucleoporin NUP49/NSP49 n=1 Tax=Candida viswanathii TaxID=5486 RepID=A0A367YEK4_9ASCO|nr:Nucleoporin NUP49/NSP49 [Candida viswanathii]